MSNRDRFVSQFRANFYQLSTPNRLSLNQIRLDLPQRHAK